jgi:hypothetical protein
VGDSVKRGVAGDPPGGLGRDRRAGLQVTGAVDASSAGGAPELIAVAIAALGEPFGLNVNKHLVAGNRRRAGGASAAPSSAGSRALRQSEPSGSQLQRQKARPWASAPPRRSPAGDADVLAR